MHESTVPKTTLFATVTGLDRILAKSVPKSEKGGVGKSTVCKRILKYLGVAIVSGQKITQDVVRGKALDSGDLPSLLSFLPHLTDS